MPAKPENKPEAVVLMRLSALGDVAMIVPVVYDLCRAVPDKTVVLVTRSWMARLAVTPPSNLVVEGIDTKSDYKGIGGMWRLARRLTQKYDIAAFIDLHDVLRSRLLRNILRLKGIPVTVIDKGRADKKRLVRKGATRYAAEGGRPLPSTITRYRETVGRAGFDVTPTFGSLFTPSAPDSSKRRIGVAPFAAHPGKVYPSDLMAQVIDRLADLPDTEIYLFGAGDEEAEQLDRWSEGRRNVINMARRRAGLQAELEIMAGLDAMLAMDSANMHLASLAGTRRVVSLWGATHPAAGFAPLNACPEDMLGAELECRPCSVYGDRPCRYGDLRCMRAIDPEKVISHLISVSNPQQ